MPTRWIWSETVPLDELARDSTLQLLRRYGLHPLIAVQPRQLGEVAALAGRCRDAGVTFGLWPMLEDSAGRWASVGNMLDYLAFCDRVLEHATVAPPSTLAIDLEPSIEWVRPLVGGSAPRIAQGGGSSFGASRSALTSFVASLHSRGIETLAAAVPLVLHDALGNPGWQRAMGTPVTEIGFHRVTVMAYPSLVEGWSRGLLGRQHARDVLSVWASRAAERAMGLSLGAVGVGAFGTEPCYRSPGELAEDVASVRRHGIEDIALLDLGGVLRRGPAEAWLEALTATAPARAEHHPSGRVRMLMSALDLAGRLLS